MEFKSLLFVSLFLCASWLSIQAQTVSKLVLVDALSDQDIGELTSGFNINLNEVGRALNVRAEVNGTIGSIQFSLDSDANYRTENTPPYSLAGDTNGDYEAWTPTIGSHSITATAFSEASGGGDELDALTIVFTVSEEEIDIEEPDNPGTGEVVVSGELKKWHKVTLSFDGPAFYEKSVNPNPFLDYRLNVRFFKDNKSYLVPGYFAADGNAAETSADTGNVWRVHFAADEIGEWKYEVSFRLGNDIAVNDDLNVGIPIAPLDGVNGMLTIAPTDKSLPDNRAKGRLQYVNERYLQFAETGQYFLKGGADAPENFLAYEDFDDTPNNGGRRKSWMPHKGDWNDGDPSWQNEKGTEIIGAINYLASKGVNVFSFLTMNINGDDKNVYPYVSDSDFRHMDCSKLDQWEIVFEHADQLGMYLHFKTQETENENLLDDGDVGRLRSLYYRELVARFGHHLALNWNMGEENGLADDQQLDMAEWFKMHDPYQHHRVIHTFINGNPSFYTDLLGNQSSYTGLSVQSSWDKVHEQTGDWVKRSTDSGKPWVVANDEQGNAGTGVPPDPGYPNYNGSNPDLHDIRKEVLWGNLMAGGAGLEYYFGYSFPESDLSLEDFRSRDRSWDYMRYALNFFRSLPVNEMQANDDLVSNGWCFALPGQYYAIYLKNGGSTNLQLTDNKPYAVRWYNPRMGEFQDGEISMVMGPGNINLGEAPGDNNEDWAILVMPETSTATEEVAQARRFLLSPNPARQQAQLVLKNGDVGVLRILTLKGQVIREQVLQGSHTDIGLTGLVPGTYLVEVQQEGVVGRQLLVVQ